MSLDKIQTLIIPNNTDIVGSGSLNFLIDQFGGFTSGYDVTLSQSANTFASPQGREFTSATRTDNDVININGWVRCVFCDGSRNTNSLTYLSLFKRVIESQKYTANSYSTIIMNDGFMENMRLVNVNFTRDGLLPEETLISSTWESSSVAGDVASPLFTNSGLSF